MLKQYQKGDKKTLEKCCPRDREQVISELIEAIASEETAIANILSSEAKTIRNMAECCICRHKLNETNESLNPIIKNLVELQRLCLLILEVVTELDNEEEE